MRVLVADNDLISRELMRMILSPFAVDLKLVENGDDAVHAAGSEPFDIILLDMNLPGLDGLAAARKIRNGACNTSSTLIAIASKTVMLSSHSPFDSALSKPLIAADVVKLLATIAEGSKASSSLKARHGLA